MKDMYVELQKEGGSNTSRDAIAVRGTEHLQGGHRVRSSGQHLHPTTCPTHQADWGKVCLICKDLHLPTSSTQKPSALLLAPISIPRVLTPTSLPLHLLYISSLILYNLPQLIHCLIRNNQDLLLNQDHHHPA